MEITQQQIKEIEKIKRSEAKRIDMLFQKYQKGMRVKNSLAMFEEPALILMRRSGKAEFYDKATAGTFKYKHCDGTERKIWLNPKYQQIMPYGKTQFRMYICHEDFPLPLPNDPIITAESFNMAIDKVSNDINKWRVKELNANKNLIWTIALGLMGVIALLIVFMIMKPEAMQQTATTTPIITTIPLTILKRYKWKQNY